MLPRWALRFCNRGNYVAIIYNIPVINARLQGVVTALDSGPGNAVLRLFAGGVLLSTITLAKPSGAVAGGVLTFAVPHSDVNAAATGNANVAMITDSTGANTITGLTVGIPLSGANVIIANGLNSTLISAGQVVTIISGQIIGS